MDFVHLHMHSSFSLLDGMTKLPDLCRRVKELGMSSVALTDHGNMMGVVQFTEEAKKNGIKPIFGFEGYMVRDRKVRERSNYHLVLLAKNNIGYKNLIKICSEAFISGFFQKPRFDFELLRKYSEGLIATTACLKGMVANNLLKGNIDVAIETIDFLKDVFKDDLYVEVMNHGLDDQIKVLPLLEDLAKKKNIKVICTNDCHYMLREDNEAHDVLLCVQNKMAVKDSNRLKYKTPEFYIKSAEEMLSLFPREYLDNTMEVAEKCNADLSLGKMHFPVYKIPDDPDFNVWVQNRGNDGPSDQYLKYLCVQSIKKYLCNGKLDSSRKSEYVERLKMELKVLKDKHLADYFLVVSDYTQWSRDQGIFVGPGRGSAAGSLVSYLLHITDVDPLKYDLLFERFLNPHRSDFPDIDIDFQDTRRHEVIDYIIQKYGQDKTCLIGTQNKMNAKVCIRDVARALGNSAETQSRIAEKIPFLDMQKKPMLTEYRKTLPAVAEIAREFPEVFKIAEKLETGYRHTGIHAAGIVISSDTISDLVPLHSVKQKGKEERVIVSQFDKIDLTKMGLCKMDILGLSNITIVQDTIYLIEKRRGIKIELPT